MLLPTRSIRPLILLSVLALSPAVQAACGASTNATRMVTKPLTCEAMDPQDKAKICGEFWSQGETTDRVVITSAPPSIAVHSPEGTLYFPCVNDTGFGIYEAVVARGKYKITMTSATQGELQQLGDSGVSGMPIDVRWRITLK